MCRVLGIWGVCLSLRRPHYVSSSSSCRRALLCGAGRSMREGCLVSNNQQQQHSAACGQPSNNINNTPQAGCSSNLTHGHGQVVVVDLPYSAQQLSVLLEVLYEHTLEVRQRLVPAFCSVLICSFRTVLAAAWQMGASILQCVRERTCTG